MHSSVRCLVRGVHVLCGHDLCTRMEGGCASIRAPVLSQRPEKVQAEIRPHQRAQGCCLWRGAQV